MKRTLSLPIFFLFSRLVLFLSVPFDSITGYGDLGHFYGWAALDGWPFLDYWLEFPPIFPFLAEFVYRLVAGRETAFVYVLGGLFSLAEAGSIALFLRIARVIMAEAADRAGWLYFAFSLPLFYGWAYFDPLAVFLLLLGIWLTLKNRAVLAGLAFGVGALVKWFPLLGLAALLRVRGPRWVRPLLVGAGLLVIVWGALYLVSPEFTRASLQSQGAKGSWETVWALLDQNLVTGNFGAKEERYDPEMALIPQGAEAVVPPGAALIPFALLGLWLYLRSRLTTPRSEVAFTGLALTLFFLWSPGWSPQWVVYLTPLILLTLPERTATLMAAALILVNLLEWPLLLSRGMFGALWLTVPLRTLLLAGLAVEFWRLIPRGRLQLM